MLPFDFHSIALILAALSGVLIPYLSALFTSAPSWFTGIWTLTLSAVAGFVAELAAASDGYDWRKALGAAVSAWLIAVVTHVSQLSGTPLQSQLHAVGSKKATA